MFNVPFRFLEIWLDTAILWLACRHHVYELHLSHLMKEVTGLTKDPGVILFRRLKAEWFLVVDQINYTNLTILDLAALPEWMKKQADSVLQFLLEHLENNTWPRADYKELVQLAITILGGQVPGFAFRLPGPDHHARWMSKAIYSLKIFLLSRWFVLTEVEMEQNREICIFVVLFFIKPWLQSPLATCAARNDINFIANILR
jgi:hypothetical protein